MMDKKRESSGDKTGRVFGEKKNKSYPKPQAVRYIDRKTASGVTFR